MSYSIEKLPGKPIILVRCHADFDSGTEMAGFYEEMYTLLSTQAEPTFLITDMSLVAIDLAGLMQGANVRRTESESANLRESIVVSDDSMMKIGMKGLNSEVYKYKKVRIYSTLDEAMAYVHEQLGKA